APGALQYHFWLDLEHGYEVTVGSRIHLYADEDRWAVVAEKSLYANRGYCGQIGLYYFGNCIDYPISEHDDYRSVSNWTTVELITNEEFERVTHFEDDGKFETVNPVAGTVLIRDKTFPIEPDPAKYRALNIHYLDYKPPTDPDIHFADLLRYIDATKPQLLLATEAELRRHIPKDIPKIMTINNFHHTSSYNEDHNPSEEELYQLIARVLVTRNPDEYRPTLKENNHWSNWESGHL
ncbi:MAG: hypothetical protein JST42_21740, partial [Bacteroidetes bacterium]|nr:hypothetical protein [Bacteroidota bacterium]